MNIKWLIDLLNTPIIIPTNVPAWGVFIFFLVLSIFNTSPRSGTYDIKQDIEKLNARTERLRNFISMSAYDLHYNKNLLSDDWKEENEYDDDSYKYKG